MDNLEDFIGFLEHLESLNSTKVEIDLVLRNLKKIQEKQLTIHSVKRSYLDKTKDDLKISKDIFKTLRKGSDKWNFYKEHIKWLESEINELS